MRKWLLFGIVCTAPLTLDAQQPTRNGPKAWRMADDAAGSRFMGPVLDAVRTIDSWATAQPLEPEVLLARVYAHEVVNERTKRGADLILRIQTPALVTAVKLFLSGQDKDGAQVYFDAIEHATPEELEYYYATVLPLVEVDVIDTLSTPSHTAWMRSIWEAAARADGTPLATRMGTHFRRLNHVAQTYRGIRRRAASRVSYRQIDEPRHLEHLGLDDRGVIYLLNGAPDHRVAGGGGTCLPHESWLYNDPAAHLIVHFAQLETANQYVLISDPEDLCAEGQARMDILEGLRSIDPQYVRLLQYFPIAIDNITATNIDNRPETERAPISGGAFEHIRRELDIRVRKMAQFAVHPLTRPLP